MAFSINSRAINSPVLHCIAVDSVGDATLSWTLPTNINAATFVNYTIYASPGVPNAFGIAATVTSSAQTSVTINGIGANIQKIYFYIVTDTLNGVLQVYSTPLDTLSSIFLQLNNPSNGTAILQYNALRTPNLPTSSGWYKIYLEYPQYVWTLVDSVRSLVDIDTITVCNAKLKYKVEEDDASGCVSVSNIDSGVFQSLIAPPAPIMDTTSVSSTNGVSISWNKDKNSDVTRYVVYERKGVAWIAIDTVNGINNTYYYDGTANPDSASLSFCVAAIDSCKSLGNLSIQQNTLYMIEAPDSCLSENLLSWNKYTDIPSKTKQYNVYMSFNGGPYILLGTTDTNTTSFLQTNLTAVGTYSYFVQVEAISGITASSNIIHYTVAIKHIPKFNYMQTATVFKDVSNKVECYVDSTAHCSTYVLERSNNSSGPFLSVATANTVNQHVYFTDPTGNPNEQSYYYKVITQNQCGINVDSSQVSQTMYLTAYGDATGTNTLTWNDYSQWLNGVNYYEIYRTEDSGLFTNVANVPYTGQGTNFYQDDVSGVLQGNGIFSYYIVAVESPSPYPFIDTSASNSAIAYQDPRVYIPNAFAPNGKNNIFIPVGVFVDVTGYDLSVFNRLGQLMFETSDPAQGWDGKYGGRVAPEAVYVYRLIYTSSKGEYFERKGSVTLLK